MGTENALNISNLILGYLRDDLSDNQKADLANWLAASDENRQLFEELIDKGKLRNELVGYADFDFNALKSRIDNRLKTGHVDSKIENYIQPRQSVYLVKLKWISYAAAVLIAASIVVLYFYRDRHSGTPPQQILVVDEQDIKPGGNKATLTLADGSVITLDSAVDGTITRQGRTRIVKMANGQLAYQSAQSTDTTREVMLNTMSTPRGGQYQLLLPDGTKIWLNAESSITYPAFFSGKSREVMITGEAYFEVARNEEMPFVVETASETITVLGTKFNVNTYSNEPASKTSLLEGSVKINNRILHPGEAYIQGNVVGTSIEKDIAWKNGFFNFKDADLPMVMRQLARWYDLNVEYIGKVPVKEFQGSIERNLKLSQVLEILKRMDIKYTLRGNSITIEGDL